MEKKDRVAGYFIGGGLMIAAGAAFASGFIFMGSGLAIAGYFHFVR